MTDSGYDIVDCIYGVNTTPEFRETQHLLYYAGHKALYARNSFDSAIWYALEHHLSVIDANLLLEELGEQPLE